MHRIKTTLPADSAERKEIPMFSGVLKYAPAALAGMARISKRGNDKHNPGEPLHHARGKSMDHGDCILRHLTDAADIQAYIDRGHTSPCWHPAVAQLLEEVDQLVWRAALFSQEIHERYAGAPLAPGAQLPVAPDGTLGVISAQQQQGINHAGGVRSAEKSDVCCEQREIDNRNSEVGGPGVCEGGPRRETTSAGKQERY